MTATDRPRDIVDEIGALVDEQLKQEPSGYDHNINQERCPHCGRHWHGLPLTATVALMYAAGTYDPEYSASEDDSPVICQGSEFIGPMPHAWSASLLRAFTEWLDDVHDLQCQSAMMLSWATLRDCADDEEPARGHTADLIVFDEAAPWMLAPQRPRRRWLRLFGWTALWFGAAFIGAMLYPSWWLILTWPVQGLALTRCFEVGREIRAARRQRRGPSRVPTTIVDTFDSEDLGPEWRHTLGVHAVTPWQWRSGHGS